MEHYISVEPGIKIFAEDINTGGTKTILFVHGWPGNHNLFEYQFNQLPKLGYRCIGIDCRGFGKSSRPFTGYDYNRLADDIRCVIESLRLRNIVLAGHSTGGAICIRYMVRHKGYGVAKLALFAAAAPSLIQRPYFPYGLPRQDVVNIIQGVYKDRPQTIRDFGNRIFYNKVSDALSGWIFQLGLEASGWGTAAIANTWLDEEQLFDDLAAIKAPTLILHGLNDEICLFPLAMAQHDGIANSRLVALEECGHFLFYDQQEKFNRELIKFLEEG